MDDQESMTNAVSSSDESAGRYLRRGLRLPGRGRDSSDAFDDSSDVFDVTVVIPTRNEAGNVVELLRRLDEALGSLRAEVLFVDDSDDETPSVIRAASQWSELPVRLLHREPGRRDGRLGGAVVAGFQLARAPWAVVIDGDLQHPPEIVPVLVGAGLSPDVDLVYGTRYDDSGDASGLNGRVREMVSRLSTVLAKTVFPRRLRGVSDPMSGLFAVRLGALDLPDLKPAGYKVLLEILAQSRLGRTVGVPYAFQPRFSGESKASVPEGVRFLVQLIALRLGLSVARLSQLTAFLAVGLSGVAVNTVAMWGLSAAWFDVPYLLASVLATNIAILWNFVLLETWVFRKVRRRSFAAGLARFWLVNVALLPVQLGLLALLVEGPGLAPVTANVLVLVVVFLLRYIMTSMWVYSWNAAPADVLAAPPGRRFGRPVSTAARPPGEMPLPRTGVPRHRSPAGAGIPVFRLLSPVMLTLVAFPGAAVLAVQSLAAGGLIALELVVVCLAAAAIVALRANPAAGEPDVHDRQLDVILAIPLLAAAIWLALGWSTRLEPGAPWDARAVVAGTTFLIGASLLLLGTRLTARIRWALCLPLLALPAVTNRPLLAVVLVAAVAITTAAAAAAELRVRHRAKGTARTVALDRSQRLPSWRLAGTVLAALAVVLAVVAVAPVQGSGPDNAAHPPVVGQAP